MKLFHADAIVIADGPVLRDGAVVVAGDGTVVSVGPAAEVLRGAHGASVTRVSGVILPGLVNAHTHLELSALAGRVRGGNGFLSWVDELLGARSEAGDDESETAIRAAVASLDAACTSAVGEVTNTLAAVPALASAGMAGTIFHEVFGVARGAALARSDSLLAELAARFPVWPSRDLSYAPSPHTLYTTHPDAVRRLLALARARGARPAVHLLEHAAERQALETGQGPVPAWLARRVPDVEAFLWPETPALDYADALGLLAPGTLLVHLTVATARELERVAASGASVVFCPRSNMQIERLLPPLASALAAGLEPALGTDSLASSPSLDVLEEARALFDAFPDADAATLLRMATWNGARALGRSDLGRVTVGARPGLFAIDLPEAHSADDVAAVVLKARGASRRWLVRRTVTGAEAP